MFDWDLWVPKLVSRAANRLRATTSSVRLYFPRQGDHRCLKHRSTFTSQPITISAAEQDWEAVKQLEKDKIVSVEALVLVSRSDDGKVHIKDNAHSVGAGAAFCGVAGALVGLIFPPALLAWAVVGAGIGAGAGATVKQLEKHQVKADIEQTLPPGSSESSSC